MNKKLLIIVGTLIAVLTAIVFLQVWGINNKKVDTINIVEAPVVTPQETPAAENLDTDPVSSQDIDSLEAQIEALGSDSLSDENLSDTEVGL